MIVLAALATACLASLAVTAHRRHRARSMWEAADLQFRSFTHPGFLALVDEPTRRRIAINSALRYLHVGWASGAVNDASARHSIRAVLAFAVDEHYTPEADKSWRVADRRFAEFIAEASQRR